MVEKKKMLKVFVGGEFIDSCFGFESIRARIDITDALSRSGVLAYLLQH